ncbi:MAG: ATP-dependent DNA helicase [Lachnospiraceae bacterium]|nr:ATP-dependent DNA helicase [Lachnospiraceae bacterium]
MEDDQLFQIRISVRGLVEFLLRGGDIDNRKGGGSELAAMQEGGRIHRMIQGKMGPDYSAEVPLFFSHKNEEYELTVEGRADGIIVNDEGVTIDEIKGTYRKLENMSEPVPVHLAQAKCYAFMYGRDMNLGEIRVRLTYCNMETEEIRYFYQDYEFNELRKWFEELIEEYHKWAILRCRHYKSRQKTIEELEFPFDYREGQKELASQVYQTIAQKKKLFLEAPTGVGKTITTVFPALKAVGVGKAEQIFYLTAKTITRTVARETFEILRSRGLVLRSIVITAKEKICFKEKAECNPAACEYAKGHLDRVNEALYALLTEQDDLTRSVIEEYAQRYRVCPFELSLDASLFADAVICDYNYVFDPTAKLQRFFADGIQGEYIFLIDEAHNLLERGREMYSAVLLKEDFVSLKRSLKKTILSEISGRGKHNSIEGQMLFDVTGPIIDGKFMLSEEMTGESENDDPDEVTGELTDVLTGDVTQDSTMDTLYFSSGKKNRRVAKSILVRDGYADKMITWLEKCNKALLEMKRECEGSRVIEKIDDLVKPLTRLHVTISDYLEEREQKQPDIMDELLEFFFNIAHFLEVYEGLDDNYVKYTQLGDDGGFMLKLFCVNPRENLKGCMSRAVSTILFSATFLPIQYYKKLLGGDKEDYEVYARSVFDPAQRGIFIADDVTSRYTRRTDDEYRRISEHIEGVVHAREGNYLVFCPSHAFMHKVYDIYTREMAEPGEECILQLENMSEDDREAFLELFETEKRLTAFCVLGGIFSEGIDLRENRLIGSIIIGTGLPQVCFERQLLKEHFDAEGEDGFDYAYRFPGINKVLQAAGRVIRTESDTGVVALLDERFLQTGYRKLYPVEWTGLRRVNVDTISDAVLDFWAGLP